MRNHYTIKKVLCPRTSEAANFSRVGWNYEAERDSVRSQAPVWGRHVFETLPQLLLNIAWLRSSNRRRRDGFLSGNMEFHFEKYDIVFEP